MAVPITAPSHVNVHKASELAHFGPKVEAAAMTGTPAAIEARPLASGLSSKASSLSTVH
ncbi:hypothetical protein [Mycobacterium sp. HUMS_1102779]|uniref:hypothetical protein n=1 Tax=Mycobacterium sp. HUMS_1102779 TaxID=3383487 RepID=UPI00389AB31C